MDEMERIINTLEDGLVSMGVSRTHLESACHKMMAGMKNPESRVVTFDIDVLDATILAMMSQEQLVRTLLVEYKARQD